VVEASSRAIGLAAWRPAPVALGSGAPACRLPADRDRRRGRRARGLRGRLGPAPLHERHRLPVRHPRAPGGARRSGPRGGGGGREHRQHARALASPLDRRGARALATRLGGPFVELDALIHGPNWAETPGDELGCL